MGVIFFLVDTGLLYNNLIIGSILLFLYGICLSLIAKAHEYIIVPLPAIILSIVTIVKLIYLYHKFSSYPFLIKAMNFSIPILWVLLAILGVYIGKKIKLVFQKKRVRNE